MLCDGYARRKNKWGPEKGKFQSLYWKKIKIDHSSLLKMGKFISDIQKYVSPRQYRDEVELYSFRKENHVGLEFSAKAGGAKKNQR